MIILIATKNIDKFNTTKGIFQKLGLADYEYKNLRDYNIFEENEEVGTMQERARDKVLFAREMLRREDISDEITLIVGIDDGFFIPTKNLLSVNSKEIVDDVLSGELLNVGEDIEEVRSYAIYKISEDNFYYYESRIPFRFLGNENGLKRIEGVNPLKHVLSFVSETQPVGYHSQDEIDEVVLGYVREGMGRVLKQFTERV